MAQAKRNSTGFAIRLSSLIQNPVVREAFERAERDSGTALIHRDFDLDDEWSGAEIERPRILQGGAAERVSELEYA